MRWEYAAVLIVMAAFPLIRSRDTHIRMYRNGGRPLLFSVGGVSAIYILWDIAATAAGHWTFNPRHVLGFSFFGLPVEEWFFFPILGFVTIFVWESVLYYKRSR